MTQDEIKQKLTDNGLGSYIPAFEQNHLLDEDVLASMTDSDYVSIGVAILGDRKKLLLLFKKTAQEEKKPASESNPASASASESVPTVSVQTSEPAKALPQSTESYFDGGVFQRLGWKILGALVTGMTFGICYPFAVCWLYDWEAKHTVIDGRRLKFTGTAGGLFGTWILCLLLSFVTCGIYALYIPIKLRRWREGNTFFEDEITSYDSVQKLKSQKASYFDGGFWQLFGWELLGWLVTVCTAGICYPWAVQMVYSWQQRHKVYCKKRCIFDGTAISLFGTWILCMLLALVTCGIYTFWIPIKIKKWQIKHTHFADNLSDEEKSEIEKQTIKIDKKKAFKIGGIVAAVFVAIWLISFCVGRFSGTSVSAEKAVDYIYSLSHDATVKVKGEISEEELLDIGEAVSNVKYLINLDLSETTGLKEIYNINYFANCSNLDGLLLPKSVEFIDEHAFHCPWLSKVKIPSNVKKINCTAFLGYRIGPNLKSAIFENPKGWTFYYTSDGEEHFIKLSSKLLSNPESAADFLMCRNWSEVLNMSAEEMDEIGFLFRLETAVIDYWLINDN